MHKSNQDYIHEASKMETYLTECGHTEADIIQIAKWLEAMGRQLEIDAHDITTAQATESTDWDAILRGLK